MSKFSVKKNIAKAKTISACIYTSVEAYEKIKEQIFACFWQFIGDTGLLKDKGGYHPEEIVQQVQTGIHSRFYKNGRYPVTREKDTHHFHQLLAEFINKK